MCSYLNIEQHASLSMCNPVVYLSRLSLFPNKGAGRPNLVLNLCLPFRLFDIKCIYVFYYDEAFLVVGLLVSSVTTANILE